MGILKSTLKLGVLSGVGVLVWRAFNQASGAHAVAKSPKTLDQRGRFDMDGVSFDDDVGVVVSGSKKSSTGSQVLPVAS